MAKVWVGGDGMWICNIMPCGPYRYILYSQLIVTHDAMITMRYRPM